MTTRARTTTRVLATLVTAIVLASLWVSPAAGRLTGSDEQDVVLSAGGGWRFNWTEQCLMRKINAARRRSGRAGLHWDRQLGFVARRHAQSMARNGYVFHDGNIGDEITRW